MQVFAPDTLCKMDVTRHDSNSPCMNCEHVGVLKKSNEVGFSGLPKFEKCVAAEVPLPLKVLGDFAHEALERQLANEWLC